MAKEGDFPKFQVFPYKFATFGLSFLFGNMSATRRPEILENLTELDLNLEWTLTLMIFLLKVFSPWHLLRTSSVTHCFVLSRRTRHSQGVRKQNKSQDFFPGCMTWKV